MFRSAQLGHEISKEEYNSEVPKLRTELLNAQLDLKETEKFQVIILIGGVDGSGRGQTVKLLTEWMDARYIETNAMYTQTGEEASHPPMWRFWNALPPRGKIGIFFGSWYTAPIVDRVFKKSKPADLDKSIDNIERFEKMLADEGALILKFWFHISRKDQKKRIIKLQNNPKKSWQIGKNELEYFKYYDKFKEVSEYTLMRTSKAWAPWIVVESADPRYCYLTVGKEILSALRKKLDTPSIIQQPSSLPSIYPPVDNKTILNTLDYTKTIQDDAYQTELLKQQKKLNTLVKRLQDKNISTCIVFEGNDAAGKGSAIRRITGALDPRSYRIVPVAAPTEEEKHQPYLWRFWRHIPRAGQLIIFDRSWYGRVLVERVEGFCAESDWKRAYSEINDFEEQITSNGSLLIKFWLSITKDEQLKRFKEREKISFKHFKITEEDWRNRKKWNDYELAVNEMVERTSTPEKSWCIVEANDKHYAHIKILKEICKRIKAAL